MLPNCASLAHKEQEQQIDKENFNFFEFGFLSYLA